MADEKIIFSMNGVSKILPHNNKVILKDIYLSFFYGAKIGIISNRNRSLTIPRLSLKWSRRVCRR